MGLTVLFVQHVNLTQALDGNLSHSGLTVPVRDSHFYLVLGFWLVYLTTFLTFLKNTGLSALVYPHFHLTRLLHGDSSLIMGLPVLVYPHFRLTRLRDGDPSRTGLPVLV